MTNTIAAYTKDEFALFEEAIAFVSEHLHAAGYLGKPVLLHSIRVGLSLAQRGSKPDVVLAGFLHDTVEDTDVTTKDLETRFGKEVARLVSANSKDASITDRESRHEELIRRCVSEGEDAATVKAADILDNFAYYSALNDPLVDFCKNNASLLKKYLPENYQNPIFSEVFESLL